MGNNVIKRLWNKNALTTIEDLRGMTFQAEEAGHTFEISGVDGEGNTIALSGTPAGVMLRPDNTDVALDCAVSEGVVTATLPAECYDVPGRFGLTVYLTSDGQKTAIYAAIGSVSRTSSGNVSPATTASVVDLINAIEDAIEQIPASDTNLKAALAATYSTSAVYPVGSYAWYNGKLYKCIVAITSGETWTSAHWTEAKLANDVCDLKSAINNASELIDSTYITYGVNTFEGMTFSGDYNQLTVYGTSTATGVRSVEYLNRAAKCLSSSQAPTKNIGPGLYKVFLRISKTLNKNVRVYVTKNTYGSVIKSCVDGDVVFSDENFAAALRVDKGIDFGTAADPTVIEFGLKKIGAQDYTARERIEEIASCLPVTNATEVTNDLDDTVLSGYHLTRSANDELVIYGTNTDGGNRVITFMNGQKRSLVTSNAFKATLSAGVYMIDVDASGYNEEVPYIYTYGSTSTFKRIERSGVYSFDGPVVIGILALPTTNFGTEENPTVLQFMATQVTNETGLVSTNNTEDRAPEIMFRLKEHGFCELDSGDFYVSQIVMPPESRLVGKGNSTRLFYIDTEKKSAISMKSKCRVDNLTIYGSTDESYNETNNSGKFPGSENKDFTGATNEWENGDIDISTASGFRHILLTNPLPAGEYYITVDSISTESPTNVSYIGFSTSQTTSFDSSTIVTNFTLNEGTNVGMYFRLPKDVYTVRMMSADTGAHSEGYTASWQGIHIYKIEDTRNGIEWIRDGEEEMESSSITNCRIERFSCAGILGMDTGTPTTRGLTIINCQIRYCNVGVYFRKDCEFNHVIGCTITNCQYGVLNRGGNNIFNASTISRNFVNIQEDMDEGNNTGHGMITSCKIHHSGYNQDENNHYALIIKETGRIVVSGCEISNKVRLQSTNGNILSNNAMFDVAIEVVGGQCSLISDSIFRTATPTRTNNTKAVIVNCYTRDGGEVTWVQPQQET